MYEKSPSIIKAGGWSNFFESNEVFNQQDMDEVDEMGFGLEHVNNWLTGLRSAVKYMRDNDPYEHIIPK